jgi:hypothetical protein
VNLDKQQTKLLNSINRDLADLKDELRNMERSIIKKRVRMEKLEEQKRLITHYGLIEPGDGNEVKQWWTK